MDRSGFEPDAALLALDMAPASRPLALTISKPGVAVLTDGLDALGLILIALGVGALITTALAPGWGGIAAGVIILAGSGLAALVRRPPGKGDQ